MSIPTCELIMLGRDTCGMPAAPCQKCGKTFCPACFPEHNKVHAPPPAPEPRKIEVGLWICKSCRAVTGYNFGGMCPVTECGAMIEKLRAALNPDGTILFYTEASPKEEKRPLLDDTTDM